MYIHAVGDFRAVVDEDVTNLKEVVKESCGKHVRRVDRFIQLSMIGSHRCIKNQTLQADCDLYLASADASKSNTIVALQQVFVEKQPLMPLNFVNLVSNAAVFYVAQSLGINGASLFLSSENSPLEKALALAALDLSDAADKQALVGVVDECATPVNAQRHLLAAGPSASLGESSIWFLASLNSQAAIAQIVLNKTVWGFAALMSEVNRLLSDNTTLAAGRSLNTAQIAELSTLAATLNCYTATLPVQNGLCAYALADFLQQATDNERFIHIECNETQLFQLLIVDKLG